MSNCVASVDEHENILVCDDGVAVFPSGKTQANRYFYGGYETGIALGHDGYVYVIDATFGATYQKTYPEGNDVNAIENAGSSGVAASAKPAP